MRDKAGFPYGPIYIHFISSPPQDIHPSLIRFIGFTWVYCNVGMSCGVSLKKRTFYAWRFLSEGMRFTTRT